MQIHSINNGYQAQQLTKRCSKPAFTSKYEIDGTTISSRNQIFTLGTLMNNFWIQDARNTFYDIKLKNVSGKFNVKVNDLKDQAFENIMKNNQIEFKKLNSSSYYY